jgi:hypothetical protein
MEPLLLTLLLRALPILDSGFHQVRKIKLCVTNMHYALLNQTNWDFGTACLAGGMAGADIFIGGVNPDGTSYAGV